MSKVVLAVDVGYGNTKSVWGPSRDASCEMIFKSVTKKSILKAEALAGVVTQMDRVGIVIDGMQYLVGPDAFEAGGVSTTDPNYVQRKEYLALLRGSMYYMMKKSGKVIQHIDALALGLPVANFAKHKDELIKIAKGIHAIPTPPGLTDTFGPMIAVNVDKVLVLPQPMGALRVHAGRVANAANSSSANLIIDPGYNTFDWLMATGMRADLERSGSFGGGVSHILKEVSHQAGMALGVGTLDMIECEEALESGVLVAGAKNYDFTPFRAVAEGVADDVIDRFINALNFNRRFSQIIMTGGGAKFYANALRKRFPQYEIVVDSDSVMTNARGFHLLASGLLL